MNQLAYAERSTVQGLAQRSGLPFAELLRGTNSFGALLVAKGYPAVPSPAVPNPGRGNYYFDGGYSVRRHCTANGRVIDGLQMELNLAGVRDTAANRTKFCFALAEVLDSFFRFHFGLPQISIWGATVILNSSTNGAGMNAVLSVTTAMPGMSPPN